MKHKINLSIVLIALLGSGSCYAGFNEGMESAKNGDYATAFLNWEPLAKRGDAKAQFELGIMYQNGEGMPQDYNKATYWYQKAAEKGNAGAQYLLAACRA